jgi:hypothetical protein
LTQKDAHALAGEWYKWFVAPREDNPGEPEHWDTGAWLLIERLQENAPDEVRQHPERYPKWGSDPEVRAGMRPTVADFGQTAQFLAGRNLPLTNEARALFLDCVLDNLFAAFSLLERRAKGDYSPDSLPKQFPQFSLRARDSAAAHSPWKLFDAWVNATSPADGTVARWRVIFKNIDVKFAGPNAQPLTEETAQTWSKELIIPGRSAGTVRGWVRAARTIYAWTKLERLIEHNPFKAVFVTVPKRIKHRETEAFTWEEAQMILRAASDIKKTD